MGYINIAFISELVIASFSKATLISFSDDVLIIKVKNVLYKVIKTIEVEIPSTLKFQWTDITITFYGYIVDFITKFLYTFLICNLQSEMVINVFVLLHIFIK